jgi:hypothetical protein
MKKQVTIHLSWLHFTLLEKEGKEIPASENEEIKSHPES